MTEKCRTLIISQNDGEGEQDNRFIAYFKFDVTPKQTGKHMTMEGEGLYTEQGGKVIKEEFLYAMTP